MRNKWTIQENDFLKENYNKLSINELASILNKSQKSIQTKIGLLKKYELQNKKRPLVKTSVNTSKWSQEQEDFVIANYKNLTCKEIGEKICKTQGDVRNKILSLGLSIKRIKKPKQYSNWQEHEIQYLIDNYKNKTRLQLANELNKTENIIRAKLMELNLKKTNKKGNNKSWNDLEDSIVINICEDNLINKNFKLSKIKEQIPHRTELAIRRRISFLGMDKYVSKLETIPEKKVKLILQENNIEYKSQVKVSGTRFIIDFVINDNIAIEVQGDYWHCNPKIYINGPKNKIQARKIDDDKRKKVILEEKGYNVIYLWESDIIKNLDEIEKHILTLINNC